MYMNNLILVFLYIKILKKSEKLKETMADY